MIIYSSLFALVPLLGSIARQLVCRDCLQLYLMTLRQGATKKDVVGFGYLGDVTIEIGQFSSRFKHSSTFLIFDL
jgi:hypothetical protein